MSGLRDAVSVMWVVFWTYWLLSSIGVKRGSRPARVRAPGAIVLIAVVLLLRALHVGGLQPDDLALAIVGTAVFAAGLALAVWARLCLGSNWGMPMTQKDEPELVTTGPYRAVRHPIYSGILLAMLGTALVSNLLWLPAAAFIGAYFVHSASVEERLLTESFPRDYPRYRARTKMLIPYLL
jgi:protein-S-isoprenylcysteine O-methyltransferase Ste14